MLLGIDYLGWFGQGTDRGPWAEPAIPPTLTYAAGVIDRATLYWHDAAGRRATSFVRVLAASADAGVVGYLEACQALSDLSITSWGRAKAKIVQVQVPAAQLDATHPYATGGHRMNMEFDCAAELLRELVTLPGIKAKYVTTDAQGRLILNTADPDVARLVELAIPIVCNAEGVPVSALVKSEMDPP